MKKTLAIPVLTNPYHGLRLDPPPIEADWLEETRLPDLTAALKKATHNQRKTS